MDLTVSVQQEPRVVQLLSLPFLGSIVLSAGPAQFGYDLKQLDPIQGEVTVAAPFKGCHPIQNNVRGKIAVMERGDCMFIDKARHIMAAGAIGGIVLDHNEGTSSETSPLFAMSGDGRNDVSIPMLFLFHNQGNSLLKAIEDSSERLRVMMGYKAKSIDEVTRETFLPSEPRANIAVGKAVEEQEAEIPEETEVIKEESPSQASTLEAPPREDATKLLLNKYMKKMKLGDIEVQIKENRQWNKEAESLLQIIEGPDKSKHISVQLENLVTSETEEKISRVYEELIKLLSSHTNLQSLSDKKDYLDALSGLIETAFTQGERGLDVQAQVTLDKLAEELKPKKDEAKLGEKQDEQRTSESDLNQHHSVSSDESAKKMQSDTNHFYLSESDIEAGDERAKVVRKAPDWMDLADEEVVIDEQNKVMYVNDVSDFVDEKTQETSTDVKDSLGNTQPQHSEDHSSLDEDITSLYMEDSTNPSSLPSSSSSSLEEESSSTSSSFTSSPNIEQGFQPIVEEIELDQTQKVTDDSKSGENVQNNENKKDEL